MAMLAPTPRDCGRPAKVKPGACLKVLSVTGILAEVADRPEGSRIAVEVLGKSDAAHRAARGQARLLVC